MWISDILIIIWFIVGWIAGEAGTSNPDSGPNSPQSSVANVQQSSPTAPGHNTPIQEVIFLVYITQIPFLSSGIEYKYWIPLPIALWPSTTNPMELKFGNIFF